MKKVIVALSLFVLCMPLISFAHPGHGTTDGYTITHYFTEPVHLIIPLSILIVGIIYFRYLIRNRQQKENS